MSTIPYAHAIVTGASSGIGAALTRRLATEGVKSFTLVARRKERLEALAAALPVPAQVLTADLSTPTGLQQVFDAVGHTDLLVNNAGFASFGAFHALPPEREVDMVKLNCLAPVALTAHYLPQMVKNGHGAVLNIASGQSFQAMPYMSTYAATKAFLLHWAEGVRAELRGTGVRMVTVCPGSVPTEFNQAANVPESELGVMSLVTGPLEDVINGAITGLSNNRGTVVTGFRNRLATAFGQMSPRSTSAWFLALVLRKAALRSLTRDESDPIAR
jgi:short-subunit dehydrogenase